MAEPPPPEAPAQRLAELSPSVRRKALLKTLLMIIVMFVAILALYFVLPLSAKELTAAPVLLVTLAACAFLAVLVWQVRGILRADLPGLRAAQALVVAAMLLITGYAALYVALSQSDGGFSEQLTRSSGLYFSVVVFSTVGFGDIAPRSDLDRLVVTSQILVDVVFIAAVARVFIGASKASLQRRQSTPVDSTAQDSSADDADQT
jgi:voltage-gated potassium channel